MLNEGPGQARDSFALLNLAEMLDLAWPNVCFAVVFSIQQRLQGIRALALITPNGRQLVYAACR